LFISFVFLPGSFATGRGGGEGGRQWSYETHGNVEGLAQSFCWTRTVCDLLVFCFFQHSHAS